MTDTVAQQQLALTEVRPLAANASAYLQTVSGFQIIDQRSCEQLADMQKQIKLARKKVEAKKKLIRDPLAVALRELDALFKPTLDELDDADDSCKGKLNQYLRDQLVIEQELQRQRQEDAAQAAVAAAQNAATLREQGAERTATAVEEQAVHAIEQAALPAHVDTVRGSLATLSVVKRWKGRVFNLKALCEAIGRGKWPAYVVEPKQAALDSLARETGKVQKADGVEFYQEIGSSVR